MDAFGRRIMWAEVERLRAAGKTIVLTTHYIEEAERLCDRICVLQRGRSLPTRRRPTSSCATAATRPCRSPPTVSRPTAGLEALGTWAHTGSHWKLATHGEPGLALAAVVTHANAIGAQIDSLDMHRPTLEDAFVALTGETLLETAQ
jgi:ABC-2 type transport system ATP-binding protein